MSEFFLVATVALSASAGLKATKQGFIMKRTVHKSQIALAAACAFIFMQDPEQTARMYKQLENCNYKIIGNIQIGNQ